MLDISNKNIITMTRGDTETISLPISTEVGENDKIFFGLMEPNQS